MIAAKTPYGKPYSLFPIPYSPLAPCAPFSHLRQSLINRIGRLPLQGLSDFPAINGEGLGEFEDGVAVEGEGSLEQGF